jgi:glutamine synthetase
MATRLEYIWVGGNRELRSKVKVEYFDNNIDILKLQVNQIPFWNYDGSSTAQASGEDSEVLIKPCRLYPNPNHLENVGFETSYYVLCDTYTPDMKPHSTNTRYEINKLFEEHGETYHPMFGIEHEFFILDRETKHPLGFRKNNDGIFVKYEPENPQGQYYCSVGTGNAYGREFLDEALSLAVQSGVKVTGSNIEVCPGQVEIQVCNYGIAAADDSTMLKYILSKLGERYGYIIEWGAKPVKGDWNGSGCHVNFSTKQMRVEGGYTEILSALERLKLKHQEHITVYGDDNCERLTGLHETSDINRFSYGVANRGCSIRIPRSTEAKKCGYFEDRRPSSSADMYLVTGKIFQTSVGL